MNFFIKTTGIGAWICFVVFVGGNVKASGVEENLHDLFREKEYYKCYKASERASRQDGNSSVAPLFAALALCNHGRDRDWQEAVARPIEKALGFLKKAKARNEQSHELEDYQDGIKLVQRMLFILGKQEFKKGIKAAWIFDGMADVFVGREGLWKNNYHAKRDAIAAQYDFHEWDNPYYRLAHTGRGKAWLNPEQQKLLLLHNLCRMNPPLFESTFVAVFLEDYSMAKSEAKAIASLRKQLRNSGAMAPLIVRKSLCKAAIFHAKDLSRNRAFSHDSPDGTSWYSRIGRFDSHSGAKGENIFGGGGDVIYCFMNLLIDHGVPGYGHRENILSDDFSYIGIGTASGGKYGKNWVFDFRGTR